VRPVAGFTLAHIPCQAAETIGRYLNRHASAYDTDMAMPEITGRDNASRVRHRGAGLDVFSAVRAFFPDGLAATLATH